MAVIEDRLIEVVLRARSGIAFTGAGASQESGIPTFRDPGGIWDRFNPAEIGTSQSIMNTLRSRPQVLVAFLRELLETLKNAEPNAGHFALAYMEQKGILRSVITQNVDDLHQEAGSHNVIELHGNFYEFRCQSCFYIEKLGKSEVLRRMEALLDAADNFSVENILSQVPRCSRCGGLMRPNVVLFGEPVHHLEKSYSLARGADLFLVIGTSGMVYPAAYLPRIAKESGAVIVEINPNGPFFSDIDDFFIPDTSAKALGALSERLRECLKD